MAIITESALDKLLAPDQAAFDEENQAAQDRLDLREARSGHASPRLLRGRMVRLAQQQRDLLKKRADARKRYETMGGGAGLIQPENITMLGADAYRSMSRPAPSELVRNARDASMGTGHQWTDRDTMRANAAQGFDPASGMTPQYRHPASQELLSQFSGGQPAQDEHLLSNVAAGSPAAGLLTRPDAPTTVSELSHNRYAMHFSAEMRNAFFRLSPGDRDKLMELKPEDATARLRLKANRDKSGYNPFNDPAAGAGGAAPTFADVSASGRV